MANTKSAKKNVLVNERNRTRNLRYKTLSKTVIKEANLAIESGHEQAEALVRSTLRTLDKLVSKGILKQSTVARKKSRLAIRLNKKVSA